MKNPEDRESDDWQPPKPYRKRKWNDIHRNPWPQPQRQPQNPPPYTPWSHNQPSVGELKDKAVIGLVHIALHHMANEEYDKAEDTLIGLINTLEGTSEKHE